MSTANNLRNKHRLLIKSREALNNKKQQILEAGQSGGSGQHKVGILGIRTIYIFQR